MYLWPVYCTYIFSRIASCKSSYILLNTISNSSRILSSEHSATKQSPLRFWEFLRTDLAKRNFREDLRNAKFCLAVLESVQGDLELVYSALRTMQSNMESGDNRLSNEGIPLHGSDGANDTLYIYLEIIRQRIDERSLIKGYWSYWE